ncbi:hypothetical protein BZG36_01442 [Bifiguratus adelaidae]|uniref:Mediator of RNA polymerase II transcription subunit 4 n=1 Tax=Bifiguratus adelaidae TaxID=1938954 RepID=A0A261Y4Y4_9FUNG|nr:hypothetical protein BZG36_01442 [Bifiguratus adelaidae]
MTAATPIRDVIKNILTEYSTLLGRLFESLSHELDGRTVIASEKPAHIMAQIIKLEARLRDAVVEPLQAKIDAVRTEMQDQDAYTRKLAGALYENKVSMEESLSALEGESKALQSGQQANVAFTDVLSYASKLSKYSSAPPNFDPNNPQLALAFEKPYPDEDRIRQGMLYRQYMTSQEASAMLDESSESESEASDTLENIMHGTEPSAEANQALFDLDLNPDLDM